MVARPPAEPPPLVRASVSREYERRGAVHGVSVIGQRGNDTVRLGNLIAQLVHPPDQQHQERHNRADHIGTDCGNGDNDRDGLWVHDNSKVPAGKVRLTRLDACVVGRYGHHIKASKRGAAGA